MVISVTRSFIRPISVLICSIVAFCFVSSSLMNCAARPAIFMRASIKPVMYSWMDPDCSPVKPARTAAIAIIYVSLDGVCWGYGGPVAMARWIFAKSLVSTMD